MNLFGPSLNKYTLYIVTAFQEAGDRDGMCDICRLK